MKWVDIVTKLCNGAVTRKLLVLAAQETRRMSHKVTMPYHGTIKSQ